MERTSHAPATTEPDRYLAPGWFTRNVMNRLIRRLTRMGVPVAGSAELRVVGRSSGEVRSTVVNPLDLAGTQYLVAPRGVTAWVRNLRAAGTGELRQGRRLRAFAAVEVADADKTPVLRAYLDAWGWEVGQFFPGISKASGDDELAAIAPGFPIFELRAA